MSVSHIVLHLFQFTLPRGERLRPLLRSRSYDRFQFTLPRGERRSLGGRLSILSSFNSRSREGSDSGDHVDMDTAPEVSIHAPARGATLGTARFGWRAVRFNSRSREGSDTSGAVHPAQYKRFNSRSREGSDSVTL